MKISAGSLIPPSEQKSTTYGLITRRRDGSGDPAALFPCLRAPGGGRQHRVSRLITGCRGVPFCGVFKKHVTHTILQEPALILPGSCSSEIIRT